MSQNIPENRSVLKLNVPGGGTGWYLLEGVLRKPTEHPVLLRLQFGNQPGKSDESFPVAPIPVSGIRLSSVLVASAPANHAWLAVEEGAVPDFASVGLRRIGRVEALVRMLGGAPASSGHLRWREVARSVLTLALAAVRGRVARGGDVLMKRYLRGLRSENSPIARAKVSLGLLHLAQAVALQPVDQLLPVPGDGTSRRWEAVGEDPKFQLDLDAEGIVLPAGWYRVRISMPADAGHLVAPCLYPDYGHGYAHDTMIRLPNPDADDRIDVLILLKHDARGLRFDPSTRQAQFALPRFHLERTGQLRAMLRMLVSFRQPDGRLDWSAAIGAVRDFVIAMDRHGVSIAAGDLFSKQSSALQASGSDYADWVRRFDTLDRAHETLKARALQVASGPLISLLLPVYETPERWLRRCVDSVLQQAYSNWELCIADDASPSEHVRRVLTEYERRDPRIRVAYREHNGHIAEASNTALELARGEYIGLLDHDDELRPHALLEVAEAIMVSPELELVYSDEDKIDEDGHRFLPYFKPDWNPDLLLSQNYICHFTVIRTARARNVGGFRKGFEGSQDHDLILRCTETLRAGQIHHVPKVLYHWRAIAGSTALERGAKDYAAAAGARAVSEHLQRIGTQATVEEMSHGHYRIHWPLPQHAPKISVIIPTRDKPDLLRTCVESVFSRTRYPNFECVVVDNRSSDPMALAYLDALRSRPRVRVLSYDAPFNYSAINNWAVSQCDGELLCLLNNDIEVISEGWLAEMVAHAIRPDIGAVGAMLYYPDGSIQHAGVILGVGGVANHAYIHEPAGYPGHGARALVAQNITAVTGACLLVRRALYQQLGGLDERLRVAFNDVDFCLRLCEAGYRNLWTPFAELYHHESATRGADDSLEKRQRFLGEVDYMRSRWNAWLHNDPAYNPNLTLEDCRSNLAFPPRTGNYQGR